MDLGLGIKGHGPSIIIRQDIFVTEAAILVGFHRDIDSSRTLTCSMEWLNCPSSVPEQGMISFRVFKKAKLNIHSRRKVDLLKTRDQAIKPQ